MHKENVAELIHVSNILARGAWFYDSEYFTIKNFIYSSIPAIIILSISPAASAMIVPGPKTAATPASNKN